MGDLALITEGLLGVKRNEKVALARLAWPQRDRRPGSRENWRDEIDEEQVIHWRERAAVNRAREVPVMTRTLRALGLTLR